jgi:putative multiple sugar transport system permease protein
MGIESNKVQIIRGLVLLIAVAFDVYSKSQGRPSLIGGMMRQFQRKDTEQNTVAAQQPQSIQDQPEKVNTQ